MSSEILKDRTQEGKLEKEKKRQVAGVKLFVFDLPTLHLQSLPLWRSQQETLKWSRLAQTSFCSLSQCSQFGQTVNFRVLAKSSKACCSGLV